MIRGLDKAPADLAARGPPSAQNTKTYGFFRAEFLSSDGRHNFRSLLCDLRVTSVSYVRRGSNCRVAAVCATAYLRHFTLEVNGQRTDSMGLSGYRSGICQVLGSFLDTVSLCCRSVSPPSPSSPTVLV